MSKLTIPYEDALGRFLEALTNREEEYHRNIAPAPRPRPGTFKVSRGRKFDKIVVTRSGSRSVYAFVRKLDGAIVKPASWKAPEPKHYERGNIYNPDVLSGSLVYGMKLMWEL
jgi:hypothetical protein